MRAAASAAVLGLLLVAPLTGLYPILLMKLMCFAMFACGFNLLLGFAGLMSFGHAMFFGGAAYALGHAMTVWHFPPELGLLVGTAAGAGLGAVVGALAIRRQGIYFAMITLALAQMAFFILLKSPFTGGENGLQGVPRGTLFGLLDLGSDLALYYVVTAIFAGCWLGIRRIVESPFGQVLKAVRDNEARATSLGYDTARIRWLAFVLSAAVAGLAGATKTLVLGFATLSDAHWHTSGDVVLMTLLGGVGTLTGPIVGSGAVLLLQSWLADRMGASITSIMGIIFIVCVLAFRRGIVGEIAVRFRRRAGPDGRSGGHGETASAGADAGAN